MITQQELKEFLHYDQDTGIFTWIKRAARCIKIGDVAGTKHPDGYVCITLSGKRYLAHRLCWLYVYGEVPENQIDHINCIRNDNRICNLRKATKAENSYNQKLRKNNTSGVKGATWSKKDKKWHAQFNFNNKIIFVGQFKNLQDAKHSIEQARLKYHGEYANNG